MLAEICNSVQQLGGAAWHVVRTRVFLTSIDDWRAVGRTHGEVFATVRPASTFVEVSRRLPPGLVVEIEAIALV